ncbi:MAG TPA: hypothetical protein VEW42_02140 [Candidatus Eisenbacteria bacterium]|nr:hypothetical protein [Candidatus Eisenbacteria bacterium]
MVEFHTNTTARREGENIVIDQSTREVHMRRGLPVSSETSNSETLPAKKAVGKLRRRVFFSRFGEAVAAVTGFTGATLGAIEFSLGILALAPTAGASFPAVAQGLLLMAVGLSTAQVADNIDTYARESTVKLREVKRVAPRRK